jgi:DNA-directed RNA polymerase specialized sigma24 family protein
MAMGNIRAAEMLNKLEEREKSILLCIMHGYTAKETSTITSIPVGTVRRQLFDTRKYFGRKCPDKKNQFVCFERK